MFQFKGTDRFEIIECLGEGGMGVVYLAQDRERHARVALKALRSLNADSVLRFKTEFRSLQDIEHQNLVSLGELIDRKLRNTERPADRTASPSPARTTAGRSEEPSTGGTTEPV